MLEAISANEIAISGLKAQRVRMNVIANNIANAMTTRTEEGGPFRRQLAIFRGNQIRSATSPERFGVNVKRIVRDPSPFRMAYEPSHPDANGDGYVAYPNVKLSTEMINAVEANRAYEANITVMGATKNMISAALRLLA